jgi:hypothetical protein
MAALIAVYPDRDTAETVVRELREHHQVPEAEIHLGEPPDQRRSVEAEMEAEFAESWADIGHGVTTAEMTRGAVIFGFVGGAVGLVLGLPIGYFLYDDSVSSLTRLAVGALIGILFGSTVGALVGGGMAVDTKTEGLAGERGVVVRIDDAPPELEPLLERYEPIRIDRIDEGQRVATPATEGPSGTVESVTDSVEQFEASARDPRLRD